MDVVKEIVEGDEEEGVKGEGEENLFWEVLSGFVKFVYEWMDDKKLWEVLWKGLERW